MEEVRTRRTFSVTTRKNLDLKNCCVLGVSWTSLITNVSGTYILVFGAGNTIGTMSMLPLGGLLFDLNPFNVVSRSEYS